MHPQMRVSSDLVCRQSQNQVTSAVRQPRCAACSKVRCAQPSQQPGQHDLSKQQPEYEQERIQKLVTFAGKQLPSQADELCSPSDRNEEKFVALADRPSTRSVADLDYLTVRPRVLAA